MKDMRGFCSFVLVRGVSPKNVPFSQQRKTPRVHYITDGNGMGAFQNDPNISEVSLISDVFYISHF